MKITPTPPSPVEGEGIIPAHPAVSMVKGEGYMEGAFSINPHSLMGHNET